MNKIKINDTWYRKCPSCLNKKIINTKNFAFRFSKDKSDENNPSHYHTICRVCKNTKKKVRLIDDKEFAKKQKEIKKNRSKRNKEKLAQQARERREQNRETYNKYDREYRKRKREEKRLEIIKEKRLKFCNIVVKSV